MSVNEGLKVPQRPYSMRFNGAQKPLLYEGINVARLFTSWRHDTATNPGDSHTHSNSQSIVLSQFLGHQSMYVFLPDFVAMGSTTSNQAPVLKLYLQTVRNHETRCSII